MKIVTGVARGLKYLHTELEPPFTISELNSSSVYLTEEFSPKVLTDAFLYSSKEMLKTYTLDTIKKKKEFLSLSALPFLYHRKNRILHEVEFTSD
jgi:hypothetical protein